MEKKNAFSWALIAAPVTGMLGAALRYWLFATGLDEKGLLLANHPAQLLIWILTGALVLFLITATWTLKGPSDYKHNFPRSIPGAVGILMAAVAAAITSISRLQALSDPLNIASAILGGISTLCLLLLAWLRFKGARPNPLFFILICVWLMVDLVLLYRQWSATPQVQNYCFSLLANVCVMLSVYYSAAFCANMGNRKMHTLFHLLAVFFCLTALPKCDNPVYFALMCGFMMLDICAPNAKPKEG